MRIKKAKLKLDPPPMEKTADGLTIQDVLTPEGSKPSTRKRLAKNQLASVVDVEVDKVLTSEKAKPNNQVDRPIPLGLMRTIGRQRDVDSRIGQMWDKQLEGVKPLSRAEAKQLKDVARYELEEKIRRRLKEKGEWLNDKIFDLAGGISMMDKEGKVYQRAPDLNAIKLLHELAYGQPTGTERHVNVDNSQHQTNVAAISFPDNGRGDAPTIDFSRLPPEVLKYAMEMAAVLDEEEKAEKELEANTITLELDVDAYAEEA